MDPQNPRRPSVDPELVDAMFGARPILSALDSAARGLLVGYLRVLDVTAGTEVVTRGDTDRSLYLILRGEARLVRGGLELGSLHLWEHFGELALIAGRPRAASVVARTDMHLAELPHESWARMVRENPALALDLLQALLHGVADRLDGMTESVGLLLHERSLPRRAEVRVRLGGEERTVRTGTPVGDVLGREAGPDATVAALLDRRTVTLDTPITASAELLPVRAGSPEGERVVQDSLGLLLLEAVHRLHPGTEVSLGHTVGYGRRVRLTGVDGEAWPALAAAVEGEMRAMLEAGPELREEWWTIGEAIEHFVETGWAGAAGLLTTWRDGAAPLVSYGEVYALGLVPLIAHPRDLPPFRVVSDEDGLLLVWSADDVERSVEVARHIARMERPQARWLQAVGIDDVGSFNRACVEGRVGQLVRVSEGFQEKQIGRIADAIAARAGRCKVVCVAGPSSSGKTTFIERLKVQLQVDGVNPIGLSLDDYYVDREATPRDADGDFDFEAFDALRVDALSDHLRRLLEGERVRTARFDFPSGRSLPDGGPELALGPHEVLLIEGIHGLNPRLTAALPEGRVFRVFIAPIAQLRFDRLSRLHGSDIRLLRRIVRDRRSRGWSAADSIARWPSVRAGERAHIYPFQQNADAVFDSSLIYEPSVLRVYAERYLLEVPHDHVAFPTSYRLLQLLDRFVSIYPDHVPPTSLLREFIGGTVLEP
jgi:uridine kinase